MIEAAERVTLPTEVVRLSRDFVLEKKDLIIGQIKEGVVPENLINSLLEFLESSSQCSNFCSDKSAGILEIGFEEDRDLGLKESILINAAIFFGVNRALFKPVHERKNDTEFSMYKSSTENIKEMKAAGIPFFQPNEKLGYHNDVFFNKDIYYLPQFVSILNLFIGYERPGNFYYINKNNWSGFDYLHAKYSDRMFDFMPTPVVYESSLKKPQQRNKTSKVPLFWTDENKEKFAFSNGEIQDLSTGEGSAVSEVRDSLMANELKFNIPQATNSIMLLRNDLGFHARDIFQDQVVMNGTTRLMLRAVSQERHNIPVFA